MRKTFIAAAVAAVLGAIVRRGRRAGIGRRPIAAKSGDDRSHRFAHSARAGRRAVADRGDQFGRNPALRFRDRAGSDGLAHADARRGRQQPEHERIFAGRAGGRSARTRSQPHADPGQRTPHRRLPAGVRRQQQFHRRLRDSDVDDRPRRNPHRQRLGGVRFGCDFRRGQFHPQEESRRHHDRSARRRHRSTAAVRRSG